MMMTVPFKDKDLIQLLTTLSNQFSNKTLIKKVNERQAKGI